MKGENSIMTLGFVVIVALATFMGAITAITGIHSAGYDIEVPGGEGTAQEIMDNMNKTATSLKDTLTGEQSWVTTPYDIFFRLPGTVLSTISGISSSAGKLISLGINEENMISMPPFAVTIIYLVIAFMIVSALIYLVWGK